MRNLLSLLLFILLFAGAYCNTHNRDSVVKYYEFIHKAEIPILEKDYSSSLKYYKMAFNTGVALKMDLGRALQVELLAPVVDSVFFEFVLRKIKEGCDSAYFYSFIGDTNMKLILGEKKHEEIFYRTLNIKPIYDPKLRAKIQELHGNDQGIRKAYLKPPDFYDDPIGRQKIMEQDSLNLVEFINLYGQYKNISEWDVGFEYSETVKFIRLHNGAWKRYDLENILREEVFEGMYSSREYAEMADRRFDNNKELNICENYGALSCFEMNNHLIIEIRKDSILQCINENRAAVFLDDYETYCTKMTRFFTGEVPIQFETRQIMNMPGEDFARILKKCEKENSYLKCISR